MIADKNVLLCFIMRGLKYFFDKNKDHRKPYIGPQHTHPKDRISSFYSAKKTGKDNKRKDQQHESDKSNMSIKTVYPLQWLQKQTHQFLFFLEFDEPSSPGQ